MNTDDKLERYLSENIQCVTFDFPKRLVLRSMTSSNSYMIRLTVPFCIDIHSA